MEKKLREWLILNSFVNDLFGMKEISDFQELLADADEGYDESGQSYFFQRLKGQTGLKIPQPHQCSSQREDNPEIFSVSRGIIHRSLS